MPDREQAVSALRAEIARLVALLETHGIPWRLPPVPDPVPMPTPVQNAVSAPPQNGRATLSTDDKIALFRRLFCGRTDVFAVRWENKAAGKVGYSPAYTNGPVHGSDGAVSTHGTKYSDRVLTPLSDKAIYRHLAGQQTIGIYPLLNDSTCRFLAVDFDEADWRDDAKAFVLSCAELGVPVALESSRDARRLGGAIISHTCARTRQLKLSSYDRLFPNQDTMPKGGFGNLIALPLQKLPRENGFSVFVDDAMRPYPDQWAFLASMQLMPPQDLEPIIFSAAGGGHPLDVSFIDEENHREPWKRALPRTVKLPGPMPESLTLTLANHIYFEKAVLPLPLPLPLLNRMIRLATFSNPEFYKMQAMGRSVYQTPRLKGYAEQFHDYVAIPRGCFDDAQDLLRANHIRQEIVDERCVGLPIAVSFAGTLRLDQELAVAAMRQFDTGVLCAPTAFGKTVTAAALIAQRATSTLIIVHRTDLLRQWQERLQSFLGVGKGVVGTIGGGKAKPTGIIDIAVMQSLSRKGETSDVVENYGHVIVDECHHVGAESFVAILNRVRAKYVLGLTATPLRRDGQHTIIFLQCGPIRHTAAKPASAPHDLVVIPHMREREIALPSDAPIQDVFQYLVDDTDRTSAIVTLVVALFREGRKVLVLTERTDHLAAIATGLAEQVPTLFTLHGRIAKKQRIAIVEALNALSPEVPRVLLSTGKLIGEGFDHPPLDTLVLSMPISWKGTLQQYAGRLHREHAEKTDVRIVDFVDTGNPALLRMWAKRQIGYRAMGYKIA